MKVRFALIAISLAARLASATNNRRRRPALKNRALLQHALAAVYVHIDRRVHLNRGAAGQCDHSPPNPVHAFPPNNGQQLNGLGLR